MGVRTTSVGQVRARVEFTLSAGCLDASRARPGLRHVAAFGKRTSTELHMDSGRRPAGVAEPVGTLSSGERQRLPALRRGAEFRCRECIPQRRNRLQMEWLGSCGCSKTSRKRDTLMPRGRASTKPRLPDFGRMRDGLRRRVARLCERSADLRDGVEFSRQPVQQFVSRSPRITAHSRLPIAIG